MVNCVRRNLSYYICQYFIEGHSTFFFMLSGKGCIFSAQTWPRPASYKSPAPRQRVKASNINANYEKSEVFKYMG